MTWERVHRRAAQGVVVVAAVCFCAGLLAGWGLWHRKADPPQVAEAKQAVGRLDALSAAWDGARQRAEAASAAGRHGEAAMDELEAAMLFRVMMAEQRPRAVSEEAMMGLVRLELAKKDRQAAQAWELVVAAMADGANTRRAE